MDSTLEKSEAMLMTSIIGLGCPIVALLQKQGFIMALQEQAVSKKCNKVSIYQLLSVPQP